jgi:hypothetical protein
MLSESTVIILGAGSSVEFGLPSGPELKDRVRTELDFWFSDHGQLERGNMAFYQLLAAKIGKQHVIPVSRVIVRGIPSFGSIDDFLSCHAEDEKVMLVGKMAIAWVIAKAEQTSVIKELSNENSVDRIDAEERVRRTWIGPFVQLLATGVSRSKASTIFSKLSIISFNYDRCFECILHELVQPTFNLDEKQAAEVMKGLLMVRPYGGLGNLHCSDETSNTPLGPSLSDTFELSQRIRVYTEDMSEHPALGAARTALSNAKTVIFLGFGYHKQNMSLLRIPSGQRPARVYATAFQEPMPARNTIMGRITKSLRAPAIEITDANTDCRKFFEQYKTLLAG